MTNSLKFIGLNDRKLEYIKDFVYLGQIMSFENRAEKELNRRITNGWAQFHSLRFILRSEISMDLKKSVFNSCILPVLTYGAQTWSIIRRQMSKLQVCQRRMERTILGVTLRDRIEKTEICQRTGVRDVAETAKSLKWNWAAHVAHMNQGRWARRVTEWYPRGGKRRSGRQRTRWCDEIRNWWEQTGGGLLGIERIGGG